jgi:hypothetical protein
VSNTVSVTSESGLDAEFWHLNLNNQVPKTLATLSLIESIKHSLSYALVPASPLLLAVLCRSEWSSTWCVT